VSSVPVTLAAQRPSTRARAASSPGSCSTSVASFR
jgi:hypothetical protein